MDNSCIFKSKSHYSGFTVVVAKYSIFSFIKNNLMYYTLLVGDWASGQGRQHLTLTKTQDFQAKFESISPYFKFISVAKSASGQETYKFQCLLCLKTEQRQCLLKSSTTSPVWNLKSHIGKRHGPMLLEDFKYAWDNRQYVTRRSPARYSGHIFTEDDPLMIQK